ncbi:hypothetical protein K435DRAFT_681625 [Dendrothele bispora CBS 962.96]|uniref:DUF6589 domain-containing protein n=1 Tax=Dendrothele bispora (strain CBS 962.96) TaxID=1314807 RepID=A0A4S8LEW0_DENBC|nr:hypothetical protein K435DRAFT_681625 [Dendrothele bispora CBS 962.96]
MSEDFGSFSNFLMLVFWSRKHKKDLDLRTLYHKRVVTKFLSGRNSVNAVHLINAIVNHRNSNPSWRSPRVEKRRLAYSLTEDPTSIGFAGPALKAWAAQTCEHRAHREINELTKNDNNPDHSPAVLDINDVSWDDILKFSPKRTANTFKTRAPFLYNFCNHLAAPIKGGEPVQRINRPNEMRVIVAINSLVVGNNRNVNGYLSLPNAVHHFACQTHTDSKRIASRMGIACHDTTARRFITSMTSKAMKQMQLENIEAASRHTVSKCYILDNIQRHADVYEGGILRKSKMKVGCSATAIDLEGCPENAWDLEDHLDRIIKNERSSMTVDTLWGSIDWTHHHDSMSLYVLQTLSESVSALKPYTSDISKRFCAAPIAIHRIPDNRRTTIQPLGTNAENELETQGMKRAMEDFDGQMGYPVDSAETLIEWVGGDGASFAAVERVKKFLAPTAQSNRNDFRNKIATPEAWHAKYTAIKAISENHFGPSASPDPSSLSKLFNCAGLKRPANPKQVDYYPMVHGFKLIWTVQVLDCWRYIYLDTDDLESYFTTLYDENNLPTLDTLLEYANILVRQYMCSAAYQRVLSSEAQSRLVFKNPELKIKTGTPWVFSNSASLDEQVNPVTDTNLKTDLNFDGDRTLANSIAFKMQFGSWLLLDHAIQGGDVGRVMQQLTIWIFMFAGANHPHYTTYLLELHCLLEFESSPALRKAILNNYLVKFGLEAQERDLMQEHHVGKLEDMVDKAGGNFDDKFYQETIAPNVDKMIHITHTFTSAFDLRTRKNSHTSPHTKPELRILLNKMKECELHKFRPTRSYPGHIALDILSDGYLKLGTGGKLHSFIRETSAKAKFLSAIRREKSRDGTTEDVPMPDVSFPHLNSQTTIPVPMSDVEGSDIEEELEIFNDRGPDSEDENEYERDNETVCLVDPEFEVNSESEAAEEDGDKDLVESSDEDNWSGSES